MQPVFFSNSLSFICLFTFSSIALLRSFDRLLWKFCASAYSSNLFFPPFCLIWHPFFSSIAAINIDVWSISEASGLMGGLAEHVCLLLFPPPEAPACLDMAPCSISRNVLSHADLKAQFTLHRKGWESRFACYPELKTMVESFYAGCIES